jgi:hypothetical protein
MRRIREKDGEESNGQALNKESRRTRTRARKIRRMLPPSFFFWVFLRCFLARSSVAFAALSIFFFSCSLVILAASSRSPLASFSLCAVAALDEAKKLVLSPSIPCRRALFFPEETVYWFYEKRMKRVERRVRVMQQRYFSFLSFLLFFTCA